MPDSGINLPLGQSVPMPGHFDTPVVLEEVRRLGSGYECRVRLPDGSLDEVVISADEAATLATRDGSPPRIRRLRGMTCSGFLPVCKAARCDGTIFRTSIFSRVK